MLKKSYTDTMRYSMVFLALAVLFCTAIVWNINTGSVDISLTDIVRIIFSKDNTDQASYNIIWKIRLPRLLTAAVLGGALSLSGFLLQTFFRNPIAGPFVLGISSGANSLPPNSPSSICARTVSYASAACAAGAAIVVTLMTCGVIVLIP